MSDFDRYKVMKAKRMVSEAEDKFTIHLVLSQYAVILDLY